jgi:branched-chain amino acid transport system substrate-binding protein
VKGFNTLIIIITAVFILVITLAIPGCAKQPPAKTFDIGIETPLTGSVAELGTQIKNTILLAIEDQNAKGGVTIAGQKYMLSPIIRDNKHDIVVARSITEELIFDKQVKVIAGPAIMDAISAQRTIEDNKVIGFYLNVIVDSMCTPQKPYSFFFGGCLLQFYNNVVAYTHEFYPQSKTVASMIPDLADTPTFFGAAQKMCDLYGLQWLGGEKFPITTTDFLPFITRVLAKNPDIIDTASSGGSIGGLTASLIKQIRQAGFEGIIIVPADPPTGSIREIVPDQFRTKLVVNDINPDSPIVSDAYRKLYYRYTETYKQLPYVIVARMYNVAAPFFEFLDGQDTMDTTAWMEGLAKYRWQGIWGKETFWVGKPIWGINRMALTGTWVSEWIDGKLETKWDTPIPMDLYYAE